MAGSGENRPPDAPSQEEYDRLAEGLKNLRGAEEVRSHEKREALVENRAGMQLYLRYTGIGIQFLFLMGLPVAGGYALDAWLSTLPAFVIAGAVLGMVGAMVFVVREVLRMERSTSKRRNANRGDRT